MNEKKLLNKERVGLLLGLCCLMCTPYGFGSSESGYEIVRFRCDEKGEKQVGDIVRLKVEIQNKGSADPGAVLTLFGLQEGANIGIENGVLIFDAPGKKTAKKEFLYSLNSGGTIIWHAAIDGDEALCTTQVKGGAEGPGDDDEEPEDPPTPTPFGDNLVASHDRSSPQYREHCNDCHADVHNRQSLDPSIPAAHVAMLPFAVGKAGDDEQCVWCHPTVDLTQGMQSQGRYKGNLGRYTDSSLCTLCHGPAGPGKQFYEVNLVDLQLDGPTHYDLLCAACHKDLSNTELRGKPAEKIQEAIDNDKGGMGVYSVLTWEQIQAIAAATAEFE